MKRITKRQAKKLFSEGKMIVLCPCKIWPEGPFSMACRISGTEYIREAHMSVNHPDLYKGSIEETAWCLMYNNWQFYNSSYEMGYYPHYYVDA